MSSPPTNPLIVPEILSRIAEFIPLWIPDQFVQFRFSPRILFHCSVVNKAFRQAILPILWYTYDASLMAMVPESIIQKYSPYFRKLDYHYSVISAPLSCTRLVELTLSGCGWDAHRLIRVNPHLKNLTWAGVNFFCMTDVPVLEGDLLKSLLGLETLKLSEWSLGHQRQLLGTLATVRSTLRRLDLDTISGGNEDQDIHDAVSLLKILEVDMPFRIVQLRLNFQFTRSRQLIDLVCHCPDLEELTLVSACRIDIGRLSANLQKHCPRLSTIKLCGLYFGLFDTYDALTDELMAELVRSTVGNDGCKTINRSHSGGYRDRGWKSEHVRGLVHLQADIFGFESLFTEALIQCRETLQTLHLSVRDHISSLETGASEARRNNVGRDQVQLGKILSECRSLREVILNYEDTILADASLLLIERSASNSTCSDPIVRVTTSNRDDLFLQQLATGP
ncbi:hypothetical protein BGX26_004959 [Mortierella sp. AD094]|nr:hypothetical protein BGX26_004959 [Mortierella sp. AD094]